MTDPAPESAPFIVLSMKDYDRQSALLEDLPMKKAQRYVKAFKQQAFVAAVLGGFELYPAVDEIHFDNDCGPDSVRYDLMVSGEHVKDMPTHFSSLRLNANGSMTKEYNPHIPDLTRAMVAALDFEDEEFYERLNQAVLTREDVVDQLQQLIEDGWEQWDVSWEEFVQQVYTQLGRPHALEERAQAWAAMGSPEVVAVFKAIIGDSGLKETLDAAPQDTWQARRPTKGLNGETESWSPLACGLMFLLNHPQDRGNHELWSLINFTTSKPDSEDAKRFLKLAGPSGDAQAHAPHWINPLALMWILSGRCSMGMGGYRRQKWSDAMLDWGDVHAVEADTAALEQCQLLALQAEGTVHFNGYAYNRCKDMLERIWTLWIAADCPKDEHHYIETYELMADTLLYYGGRTRLMPSWVAGKGMSGFVVGPGTKLSMADRLDDAPVDLALRMSLTTLAKETNKKEIAAAHTFISGLLDQGAGLIEDDAHLDKRLAGQGVSQALRERILGSLKANETKALAQLVQATIEANGWRFVCQNCDFTPEEVAAPNGFLPLLLMHAWAKLPEGVQLRNASGKDGLLGLVVDVQGQGKAEEVFEGVRKALEDLARAAAGRPVNLDPLYEGHFGAHEATTGG